MTQEDKTLLLKDLCARLPYRVKIDHFGVAKELLGVIPSSENVMVGYDTNNYEDSVIEDIKPYLRPMSSMTEEEKEEYTSYCFEQPFLQKDKIPNLGSVPMCISWLLEHHFDFNSLIERGLALEAPEGMYNTK